MRDNSHKRSGIAESSSSSAVQPFSFVTAYNECDAFQTNKSGDRKRERVGCGRVASEGGLPVHPLGSKQVTREWARIKGGGGMVRECEKGEARK